MKSGDTLGSYQVLEKLGAGGMGEVYRARDTRLGREVALKVLPEAFARDSERMARFEREARLLASLNHPHIAAIYGLEEIDGLRAIAMELVEGDELSALIGRGAAASRDPATGTWDAGASSNRALTPAMPGLPLDEALSFARQIAEALEAAHEKGVIHRDLKPANVKVNPDGQVKVLDFGLAKALDSAAGSDDPASTNVANSPTISAVATRAGVILGTAAYMSPEQARGKPLDRRTDIWSFGCLLYEMLTGRMTFRGETVTDTLAGILEREPDWQALPAATPPAVRRVLRRCLQKDPKHRLRDIADARMELDESLAAPASGSPDGARLREPRADVRPQRVAPPTSNRARTSLAGPGGRVALVAWALGRDRGRARSGDQVHDHAASEAADHLVGPLDRYCAGRP